MKVEQLIEYGCEIRNGHIIKADIIKEDSFYNLKLEIEGDGWGVTLRMAISEIINVMCTFEVVSFKAILGLPCQVAIKGNIARNVGNIVKDKWIF